MLIEAVRYLLALVFLAAGCFLSWGTWRALARRSRWLHEGVVVTGRVVALKPRFHRGMEEGPAPLAPVVSVTMQDGTERKFTSSEAQRPAGYTVGQEVAVRYIPNDPKAIELDRTARSLKFVMAIATLAAFCLAAAVLLIVVMR